MKGWTEEEIKNKELMAPCGLYCGVCGVYIATRENNNKFKEVLGNLYGTTPEATECLGCMQSKPYKNLYEFCKICNIRDCVNKKGFYSCHQCDDWPCEKIENFGFKIGVKVMKRAIPKWRKEVAINGDVQGSINWARSECEMYHCNYCGEPLFRGAQKCRSCKNDTFEKLEG